MSLQTLTRHRMHLGKLALSLAVFAAGQALVWLSGCSKPTKMETLRQEKVLHVVTRKQPSSYYEDRDGPAGLEYDLARMFADALNVELRLRFEDSPRAIKNIVQNGFAYFAMAGFGITEDLQEQFVFSMPYMEVAPVVLYRKGTLRPRKQADLQGKAVHVVADTHLEAICRRLTTEVPELSCVPHDDADTADLMGWLEENKIAHAMVDSNELKLYQSLFPHAAKGFELNQKTGIAWLLPKSEDTSFLNQVNEFLDAKKKDGTLEALYQKYYGHITQTNYVGARTFIRHIESRLPRLRPHFEEVAKEHDLDWRLLAAIAYQESHWNPKARSATGVRGIMMLTRATAREMGVKNRLDPKQSIEGGTRYLLKVKNKIPSRIPEPDRTWFALAAYNVGYGHLEDARILTQKAGKNPDRWEDVAQFLPRLAQKKWYKQTRHGYARGSEPVHYVKNIRRYYETLVWMDTTQPEAFALDQSQERRPTGSSSATISQIDPALRYEEPPPTL